RIDCFDNQFSELTLSNLPRLDCLYASRNKINKLTINNCSKIGFFDVGYNSLPNLDFLDKLNTGEIKFLYVSDNDFPIKDIEIFISEGFEYLSDTVKEVSSVLSEELEKSTDQFKIVTYTGRKRKGRKELEKMDPNIDIYDVVKNIFFNVRTGEFI
ncbi:4782_t:CDS:2, partial [Funneliformis geosporum]